MYVWVTWMTLGWKVLTFSARHEASLKKKNLNKKSTSQSTTHNLLDDFLMDIREQGLVQKPNYSAGLMMIWWNDTWWNLRGVWAQVWLDILFTLSYWCPVDCFVNGGQFETQGLCGESWWGTWAHGPGEALTRPGWGNRRNGQAEEGQPSVLTKPHMALRLSRRGTLDLFVAFLTLVYNSEQKNELQNRTGTPKALNHV